MSKPNNKLTAYLLGIGLTSAAAISGGYLIAPWEGKENKTYLDPVGIVTSCYGHTGPELKLGMHFTDQQCMDQLAKDIQTAQKGVRNLVRVPLNQYQEAALISFTYNAGVGNLRSSTMLRKFNSKDYVGGCQELIRWVYAQGKKLIGLVNRRSDEMQMCLGKVKVEIGK